METPSKSSTSAMNKVLANSNRMSCDSPFGRMPNVSTPPSRFARILNPFESHLIERLHLPTFSPSVFAQVSTPKTDGKFKWSIDDISSLKPADIDEDTVSQHVCEYDPTIESMMQEKIDNFFKEKVIVPSPMNAEVQRAQLASSLKTTECTTSSAQTVLTFPAILPKHIEDLLQPYFTYTCDQQQRNPTNSNPENENSSLYRKLFEFEEDVVDAKSIESSPALSTHHNSVLNFNSTSPPRRNFENSIVELPELRDCELSPISRSPRESRSACRLNFSSHMSIDASLVVPDVNNQIANNSLVNTEQSLASADDFVVNNSTSGANWDMEYKHVSILSRSPLSSPELYDSSNSNTPHSKIFTSQRKRLSDSFKDDDNNVKDVEMDDEEDEAVLPKRVRNLTDTGYHTGENSTWHATHMFASTPTKNKN